MVLLLIAHTFFSSRALFRFLLISLLVATFLAILPLVSLIVNHHGAALNFQCGGVHCHFLEISGTKHHGIQWHSVTWGLKIFSTLFTFENLNTKDQLKDVIVKRNTLFPDNKIVKKLW